MSAICSGRNRQQRDKTKEEEREEGASNNGENMRGKKKSLPLKTRVEIVIRHTGEKGREERRKNQTEKLWGRTFQGRGEGKFFLLLLFEK